MEGRTDPNCEKLRFKNRSTTVKFINLVQIKTRMTTSISSEAFEKKQKAKE